MNERLSTIRNERGFTIIEVMVAAFILVLGVLGVATLVNGANAASGVSQGREAATNLARQIVEAARSVPYTDLDEDSAQADLIAQDPTLADSSGVAGWQIPSRGRTYTVTVEAACSFDDSSDGTAETDAARPQPPFCANSDAAGQAATNGNFDGQPDDYKVVRVQAAWSVGSTTRSISVTSLINNPGSAFSPAVSALTSSPGSPITSANLPANKIVTVNATFNRTASSTVWTVNGVAQPASSVSGSGLNWSFAWNLTSVPDGNYRISVQGFKSDGVAGQPRVITVVVNLGPPKAPLPFTGGRNVLFWPSTAPQVVELEWQPTGEADVLGYSAWVQRGNKLDDTPGTPQNGSDLADERVCPVPADPDPRLSASTSSCRQPDLTSLPEAGGPYTFYVVGWDRAPVTNTVRAGAKATISVACFGAGAGCNRPPNTPTMFGTPTAAGGTVEFHWNAVTDPNTGDSVRYYRIYRTTGSVCPTAPTEADRYSAVNGSGGFSTFGFSDSDGATPHCYFVTAADQQLAESTPLAIGAYP